MPLIKEITAVIGQYTNKEGKTKNRYQRIGSIIDTRNGWMLKLDNIPQSPQRRILPDIANNWIK